jgi:predicted transcriptional regulator
MALSAVEPEVAAKMATEILVAYLSNNAVAPSHLPQLILDVRVALERRLDLPLPQGASVSDVPTLVVESPAQRSPAVDSASEVAQLKGADRAIPDAETIAQSIQDNHLVSFEDKRHYRSLKRHLMAKYGMTPEEYRRKWNLPADYPMVAPSYARERSEVAKRIGLGRGSDPEARAGRSRGRSR